DTLGALKLSWPLVLGPLLLLAFMSRRQFAWPRVQGPVTAALMRRQLSNPLFWGCGATTLSVGFLSVGVPLLQVARARRTWTEWPDAVAASTNAIWHSFLFAAATGILVICIGLVRALWTLRKETPKILTEFFHLLLWVPFLIPGVLLGILLIAMLNHPLFTWFYQSTGIVVLAFVLRYLV